MFESMSFSGSDVVILITIAGFFIRQEITLKSIASVLKGLGKDHEKLMGAISQGENTTIDEHRGQVEALHKITSILVKLETILNMHLDEERSTRK